MKLKDLKHLVDRAMSVLGGDNEVIITVGHLEARKNYVLPSDDLGVPVTDIRMFVDPLGRWHMPVVEAPVNPREHEPLKLCPACRGTGLGEIPKLACGTCLGKGCI